MHLPINVKSPNNISKWQMEFNSAFKGLMCGESFVPKKWTCHVPSPTTCTAATAAAKKEIVNELVT
jgi:hypothetical protein